MVLAIAIFGTIASDFSQLFVFNPPYLLFALNLSFWTVATVAVAFISGRSFVTYDSLTAILIGVSAILLGSSVITSGWVANISGDYSVAIANICSLVAAVVLVLGAGFSFAGKQKTNISPRKVLLFSVYLASLVFVAFVSAVVLSGFMPNFFLASGPTLLRQVVLGFTVLFFGLASIIFGAQYWRSRSNTLFWYMLAIALFSLGFFSAFEVKVLGDVATWLGRITLYAANLFLIAALFEVRRERDVGADLSNGWTQAFVADRNQSGALLANMLNAFAYAKVVVDDRGKPVDWVYLDVNSSFEKLVGLDRRSIVGKKASAIFPNENKGSSYWIGNNLEVALSGKPVRFQSYRESLGKWVDESIYSPKKGYLVTILEDITKRKNAEKEIVSLAKFPAENPSAVLRVDRTGSIMYANPRAGDFLEEWHAKVGERVPERVGQNVVDALSSGDKIEFEERLGEETFAFLVAPVTAEGYANLYGRNVTKRKKAEAQLEEYAKNLEKIVKERTEKIESDALYARSLIEASLDPLVTISADGKITDVNKATELATGCSRETLIGSDFSTYFTEPEKAEAGYKQVFKDCFVKDYPLALKHKSGTITEVLYNATVFLDSAGKVGGVFAAARDVTERRRLEKLVRAAEHLASIGATAGMVGHDIRNPLQAITGDVYLAKGDLALMPDGEAKDGLNESLAAIEENVDYINKIVQDLQDYAKPLNPVVNEVDLQSLIEDVLLKSRMPKTVVASCKIDKNIAQAKTDTELLRRVITNLVTNAIQAMPKGGSLSIRARRDRGDAVIEVEDTGVGIPEDIRPRLFTPLFTTKSKGQGFGLAVVKRVTEAMNGTVSFESKAGKGTKFLVRLPQKEKNSNA